MTQLDEYGALSLGAVVGGIRPAAEVWADAVTAVSRRVAVARVGADSPLALNVVFHIPGEILAPDFSGLRTGKYSAREHKLMIQIAMPDTDPPDNAERVVTDLLMEAVEEAERFAQRKKLTTGPLEGIRSIISRL